MIPNAKTFLITIPRNSTRFNATMAHLKSHSVEPAVFTGVDGAISGLKTRLNKDFEAPELQEKFQRWMGCYLSHYFLWKACSYQPNDVFVILEDDVRLEPDWCNQLDAAMAAIPISWDLLFLGSCCVEGHEGKVQIQDRLWKISYANCTHAYAIRKKALPILLEKLQAVKTAVDISISLDAIPYLESFAVLPSICFQEGMILPP